MGILIERHLFEIHPASTSHGTVTVFVEDGELWIKQSGDSISLNPNSARLLASAICKALGGELRG